MFYGIFFPLEVKFADLRALKLVLWQWYRNNDKFKQRQECKCWFAWLLLNFSFLKKHELSQLSPEKNHIIIVVTWEQIGINKRSAEKKKIPITWSVPYLMHFSHQQFWFHFQRSPTRPVAFLSCFRNCEFSGALKVSATWGKTSTNITLIFSQYKNK